VQAGKLPKDVLQFVADEIDTVPHLEALLLLFEQPAEHWTVERTAARLYVPPEAAARILQDLERRRLVKPVPGAEVPEYVYDPEWDVRGRLMADVAAAYRRKLAAVAVFIHTKGSRSVREFARAFDFKKNR
jgi:hypothetical protein